MKHIQVIIFVFVILSSTFVLPQNITKAATVVPPWDFEDHTYNHADLTTMAATQIATSMLLMNNLFQEYGLPAPEHVAYPYGNYNTSVINSVSQYRKSGRMAWGTGLTAYPVSNWYAISTAFISSTTTYAQVQGWINNAVNNKHLLTLFTHKVSQPAMSIGCTPALLTQVLDYLVAQQNAGKLTVLTMRQAYTAFDGQKAVVVLSFDDGWVTDYTTVWPLFKARGLAGTSFIVGSSVGSANPDCLTWAMVTEMAQISQPTPTGWQVTINVSPQAGGTTKPYGSQTVTTGTLNVTATPAANYIFKNWVFDGTNLTSNPVTLPAQTAGTNHTLTAYFSPTAPPPQGWLVTINVNGSIGGTTSPSGLVNVTLGTLNVTAYPAANYTFAYWLFDGENLTSNPVSLPSQNPGTSHALTAFFSRNIPPPQSTGWLVSIGANPAEGGTTNPSGLINVTTGSLNVTAYPAANYTFNYWLFDGVNFTANPVTLPQQIAGTSHTLTAFFAADPPALYGWLVNISVNGSLGGTTSPSGLVNVTSGTLTCTAFPATGYAFNYWLFDGKSNSSNSITLSQQTAGTSHVLTAFFTATTTKPPAWDFEDHTYNHLDLTTLTTQQIIDQLNNESAAFQNHGLPAPQHLAYPSGNYNSQVISVISQYRLTARTAGGGSVFPETYPVSEWYTMSSACMQADITFDQAKQWIDTAVAKKGLLNLFTHKVSEPPITYGCTPQFLTQVLDYLVQLQNAGVLQVMTMRQAYSAFDGTKAVVVISFDDGWITDYTVVWPLFTARGLAGTSYIHAMGPDSGNPDSLTWQMTREMAQVA